MGSFYNFLNMYSSRLSYQTLRSLSYRIPRNLNHQSPRRLEVTLPLEVETPRSQVLLNFQLLAASTSSNGINAPFLPCHHLSSQSRKQNPLLNALANLPAWFH